MRLAQTFLLLGLAASLAACASAPDRRAYRPVSLEGNHASSPISPLGSVRSGELLALVSSTSHQKVGNTYTVMGRTYTPRRDDDYDRRGIASWYGPNFHGGPTANGEIFDQNLMTAAHKTLPIPSIVDVTNLDTGRTIRVRLNDRGPFVDDRIIDLSRAAAAELGFLEDGLAPVRVRYIGPAAPLTGRPAPALMASNAAPAPRIEPDPAPSVQPEAPVTQTLSGHAVQVGAFSSLSNAQIHADRLRSSGEVWIASAETANGVLHRVYYGRWTSEAEAEAARQRLRDRGVYDARVVSLR